VTEPELVKNVLRSMREVAAYIRRDKAGVVTYIEQNFKVTPVSPPKPMKILMASLSKAW
jgi:hypothetical protein